MTRLQKLSDAVKNAGLDAAMIVTDALWAAGFRGSRFDIAIVLAEGGGYALSSSLNFEQVASLAVPNGYEMLATGLDPFEAVADVVKKHGIKTLGYENSINVGVYRAVEGCGARLCSLGGLINTLKGVKEEADVMNILAAQTIAEKALDLTLPTVRPGVSERDIAAELNYHMAKLGSQRPAFNSIIVSGPNSSLPHGEPSERILRCGDFLTIDFGATVNGMTSDMTRTFAIGFATEKMKFIYDTVLRAQLAAIDAFKVGATGDFVHNAALNVIAEAGYGENFIHSLGHSMGGGPEADAGVMDVFEVGNVVTVEPGIYIPGYGGVRIEDMVWLSPKGPVNLTKYPKELMIL